jgi:RimJ/RimL family protein N-acetyltransferase
MLVLEGDTCSLISYDRILSKKDILHTLWKLTEEDGDSEKILWAFEHKDLTQFIQCVAGIGHLLLIVYTPDYSEIAGFIWFNTIQPGFKANIGVYIRKKYRKQITDEATKLSTDHMFHAFDVQGVWAHTIWDNARKATVRTGFQEVAIIPDSVLLDGKIYNQYISVLKRK